jgi:hypothetical protein
VVAPGNVTFLGDITGSVNLGPAPDINGKTYQIRNINTNGGDTIYFDVSVGPINLYITGTINMGGHSGFTFSPTVAQCCGLPCNCHAAAAGIIVIGGGDVTFNGNTNFTGYMYAPQSAVQVQGGGNGVFQGIIVADSFSINGGGAGWFHYDRCLDHNRYNQYAAPPVIINTWQPY